MIKKQPTERDLTIKQRKWLKAYIQSGNATEAAYKVYDCKDRVVAASIGYENLRKLQMDELMEEMGLTDVALTNVIAEGITKPVKSDITGAIHPDYGTRHKYIETALKLKKRAKDDDLPDTTPVQVNIHPAFLQKYGDIS